ncbi:MAG: TonB-dependent receptor plug domain-containing protein, partial [bacterium]
MNKFFFIFFIILTFYVAQALDEKANNDFTEEKEFIEKEIDYTFKVQSISKYSKSIIDSPAFISLIFPFELKFFYHVNIGDLLNFSPGLYVVEDGAYWYLGSKGVQLPDGYNSRTLFLFDGLPINEVILGNVINYSPFFLNSLEIVHGYSNVYSGSNSLLGTINFIPYFEEDDNIRNEMSRTTYFMGNSKGSDNFLKARFVKLNNIKLDFGLNLGSYNGRDIFLPQRNELSIKDDNRYYKFYYLFGNYEKLNSKTSFYFSHFFNRIHYPTGAYGIILNDRKDYLEDVFDHFYIKHSLDLPNNSKLNLNISYLDYYQYGRYPTSGNSLFINVDNFSNKIFSFDVNYSRETKINSFLIGLEYKSISYGLKNYDIDYFDESFIDIYLDLKKLSVPFYSLYFSYEHKFNYESEDKYWLFSFSCRYDDYTSLYGDFKSIIVPQLSLIRVEKSKALKLIYSQNYRPPSISESYYNDGGISEIANPNLAPEKHKTWHLIYYQELKRKNLKGYFSMGLYF